MEKKYIEEIFQKKDEEVEFIPLGSNCSPSHILRKFSLRTTALPFDWNITPINSAIELIENKFDEFLVKSNTIFLPPTFRLLINEEGTKLEIKDEIITPVYCSRYKMLFPHDYPKDYENEVDAVKKKYTRRITKLYQLLNSDKKIIFLHNDEKINSWQESQFKTLGVKYSNDTSKWKERLTNMVARKFPDLKFSCYDLSELIYIITKK